MKARFTDQMGRSVEVKHPPVRIVSLVPSQTELLADLGLEEEVAGVTKFCIHPEKWFRQKPRVGGTKMLDMEKIAQLQPDLVIGNKEENEEAQIRELMQRFPVWLSDVKNLHEATEMIHLVGQLTGREKQAHKIIDDILQAFAGLKAPEKKPRAAYFIWRNPYMVAGGDTFLNDMMARCGLVNVFAAASARYPRLTAEELQQARPDVLLLSSEPFPFAQKHVPELQALCPGAKVLPVDGEMFSWYGSRLLKVPAYLAEVAAEIVGGQS